MHVVRCLTVCFDFLSSVTDKDDGSCFSIFSRFTTSSKNNTEKFNQIKFICSNVHQIPESWYILYGLV